MAKPRQKLLPISQLGREYTDFLDAWDIGRGSTFLPPEGNYGGAHVWAGRIVEDETVVIGAADKARVVLMRDTVLVGIVSLGDIEDALKRETDPLIAYTEAATHQATGLKHAIWLLDRMKGLPDGEKGISKSPFMEDDGRSHNFARPMLTPGNQVYYP